MACLAPLLSCPNGRQKWFSLRWPMQWKNVQNSVTLWYAKCLTPLVWGTPLFFQLLFLWKIYFRHNWDIRFSNRLRLHELSPSTVGGRFVITGQCNHIRSCTWRHDRSRLFCSRLHGHRERNILVRRATSVRRCALYCWQRYTRSKSWALRNWFYYCSALLH